MNSIYLLTGGNMGDRLHNLNYAADVIEATVGEIEKRSSIYETAAWGFTEQASFLNQVICLSSTLNAEKLLQNLLDIEEKLGRKRVRKMGPRAIDIDILFYGQEVISTADLIVPHPRMPERRFVLTPLNEIAADFVHPILKATVHQLLQTCPDTLEVKLYKGD